ncbi:MAG: V-type ATP synthase subunit F [Firmicutes bacterium]|nr:V-type ATP synthase subunit F [Bacillota bacterium]
MSKVAVIGNNDAVLGFKALGVSVFPVASAEQAAEALKQASEEDFSVVFVTEPYAAKLDALLTELKARPSPVITVIPDNRGNVGLGMKRIKSRVEKAIGVDILFKEEGSGR